MSCYLRCVICISTEPIDLVQLQCPGASIKSASTIQPATMKSYQFYLFLFATSFLANQFVSAATSCSTGYYLDGGNCYPCPPGSYCPDGYRKLDCNIGEYQTSFGASSCSSCQDGSYTTETGSLTCNICPMGSMCPNNDRDPIPCPAGTYQNSYGSTRCLQCSSGYYSTATMTHQCEICPKVPYHERLAFEKFHRSS